jgi:hypothetical protein
MGKDAYYKLRQKNENWKRVVRFLIALQYYLPKQKQRLKIAAPGTKKEPPRRKALKKKTIDLIRCSITELK